MFVDSHSHLYAEEYDLDIDQVIRESIEAGVECLLLPNVDEASIDRMHKLELRYPDYCHAMMGIHPTSVTMAYEQQLELIRSHLDRRAYCGMGEIGIDLYWSREFEREQRLVFDRQLTWAEELNLPVAIHMRDSLEETLEVVSSHHNLRGVFHSFTGVAADAVRILDAGDFYLGINGVVTFKNSTLRQELEQIPLDRLLLETDAPYLTPVPNRGRRNHPKHLIEIAETLSTVYRLPIEEVARQTTANARKLFPLAFVGNK